LDNQSNLEKIKGELIETLDKKNSEGVDSNKNDGKQLKTEIEGVLTAMNKKVTSQTDESLAKVKAHVNE
jgi:hypothetical protein